MRAKNDKWTIYIGSWTLSQWLGFSLLLVAVAGVASYITGGTEVLRPHLSEAPERGISASNGTSFDSPGEVINVVDGDTLDVSILRTTERIRLSGIDCPEIKQPFGQAAKMLASDLSLHKEVDVRAKGHDKYGRVLAIIAFPDGRILNEELLKAGLAWWYEKYDHDTHWANLEHEAKARKMGLWSDPQPIAPWDFRAEHTIH